MTSVHAKASKICVSEGIYVSLYVLSEEWESYKSCVSQVFVKRICINQEVGVELF